MKGTGVPMRKCVGCMESRPKSELLRIAAVIPGEGKKAVITADPEGKLPGRGAYLCKNMKCFETAKKKKSVGRTLRTEVSPEDMKGLEEWFYEHQA